MTEAQLVPEAADPKTEAGPTEPTMAPEAIPVRLMLSRYLAMINRFSREAMENGALLDHWMDMTKDASKVRQMIAGKERPSEYEMYMSEALTHGGAAKRSMKNLNATIGAMQALLSKPATNPLDKKPGGAASKLLVEAGR